MADEDLRSYKPLTESQGHVMDAIGANISARLAAAGGAATETLADSARPFAQPPVSAVDSMTGHRQPGAQPMTAAAAAAVAAAAAGAVVPSSAAGLLNPLMEIAARLQYHRQMELFYEDCHRREKYLVETQAEELRMRQMWLDQELMKERRLEEQKRLEQERIEQIKSKPKERESANASDEVKQVLRSAIINRAKRGNGQRVMWARTSSHDGGGPDVGSPRTAAAGATAGSQGSKVSPPLYRSDALGRRHDAEFPIRKVLSEPNLKVKAALRQRLAGSERRGSPLAATGRTASSYQPPPRLLPPSHQLPDSDKYSTLLTVDTGAADVDGSAAAGSVTCDPQSSTPPLLDDSRRRLLTLASYGSMASLRGHEEGLLRQMKQQLPAEFMHISLPNIPLATLPSTALRDTSGVSKLDANAADINAQRVAAAAAAAAAAAGSSKSLAGVCADPSAAAAALAESFAQQQQQQHAAAAAALLSALGPSLSAVAAATVGAQPPGRILHPAFQPSFPGLQEEDYHLQHQLPLLPPPPTASSLSLSSGGGGSSGSLVHDARLLAHPYLGGKSSLSGDGGALGSGGGGGGGGGGGLGTAAQQALQRHLQQRHQQHKPIARTHSAPLPIHHPAAAAAAAAAGQSSSAGGNNGSSQQPILVEHQRLMKRHQEQYLKEQQKKMILGQLRQTILQRSGSRSHMEHVSEEAEARLAMEMQESREDGSEPQELRVVQAQQQHQQQQPWLHRHQAPQQAVQNATRRHGPSAAAGSEQQLLAAAAVAAARDHNGEAFAGAVPLPPPSASAVHHGMAQQHRLSRARSSPLVTGTSAPPGRLLATTNGAAMAAAAVAHALPDVVAERLAVPVAAGAMRRTVPAHVATPVTAVGRTAAAAVAALGHPGSSATGLAYDESMLRHTCVCGGNSGVHLESPDRLLSIWQRLTTRGLVARCERVDSKKATMEQLQLCHAESYSLFFGVNSANRKRYDLNVASGFEFVRLPCGGVGVDADTVWNEEHSAHASRVAAGCVLELASRVTSGTLLNGMAIVRPPGHHAEHGQAMGFCYFNSIAIAAKWMKRAYNLKRILIVDWDVHHGNGTQQMTYDDPHILYMSLHRHDDGNFFPGTGAPTDCGQGPGLGYNVNVAFSGALNPPMGDAEYLAAFRCLVLPIASDYKPELVLISAGFDAADGHAAPLGGYKVSPSCFGLMTQQLMAVADGRVVLVLEGGYDLGSICDSSEACVRALLGEQIPLPRHEEVSRKPCDAALASLAECMRVQARFWPSVARHSQKLTMSHLEALHVDREATETVSSAMASLSMAAAAAAARNGMTTICDMNDDDVDADDDVSTPAAAAAAAAAEADDDCLLPPSVSPAAAATAAAAVAEPPGTVSAAVEPMDQV